MGDKVGRIHMKKQDLGNMGGRRMNVLRNTGGKKRRQSEDDGPAIVEEDAPRNGGRGAKRSKTR